MSAIIAVATLYSVLVTVLLILERRRVDELLRQLLAMRRDGFAPVVKAKIVDTSVDGDGDLGALRRAEAAALAGTRIRTGGAKQFVKNIVDDLRAKMPNANESDLKAEADRLRRELLDEDAP